MIGDYDGMAIRYMLKALHLGGNAREYKNGSGGPRGQPVPQRCVWYEQGRDERDNAAQSENRPGIKSEESAVKVCDAGHFMLMPYGFCDSDHACYEASSSYSKP